uniref:Putative RNA-binding protein Luc7-like 2 n=1 Tax=Phallusia mammillata TaxID=59560 RepID=A0A6F9DKA7_9ASCI|nr:putative RNA-binding protein Luc7-like 2 [Phallusia mammillata]
MDYLQGAYCIARCINITEIMSAQSQMRAMLDQLMGTQRDGGQSSLVKFNDDRVCRSFLLGCCPNDILSGTRADIGECRKIHDLALKADYEMASKSHDYYFDFDAYEHVNIFISETDQKILVSKKRLADQQAEVSAEVQCKANTVHDLNEQIGKLLVKAEELGMNGNIDESKIVLDEVEKVKKLKTEAEEAYRNSMPASTYQQQKLRVCDVCSAYLGLHDNDCRLADHFGGKLHAGFIEIREQLSKLKSQIDLRKRVHDESKKHQRPKADERSRLEYKNRSSNLYRRRSPSPNHRQKAYGRSHEARQRPKERSSRSTASGSSSSRYRSRS